MREMREADRMCGEENGTMADSTNPNDPPMHHDIVGRFAAVHVWLAGFLGVAATVVGIVLGLVLVND